MNCTIDSIENGLLEQFKGKPNTHAIMSAIDRQIVEFVTALNDIANKTSLDTATGKQLDNIGAIVNLTRAQAAQLCGQKSGVTDIDDESYRKYLKYQAFRSSNDGTYNSLMKSLKIIDDKVDIVGYVEDETTPATIILNLESQDEAINIQSIPIISSAGISIQYNSTLKHTLEVSHDLRLYPSEVRRCGTFACGEPWKR